MESGQIEAVLFDKDGTLVDFHATWMPAYRTGARWCAEQARRPELADELLRLGGFDVTTGRCLHDGLLACGSTPELAQLWGAHLGITDVANLARRLEELYRPISAEQCVPVAGLDDALAALGRRELLLGVATMDSEAGAHLTLATLAVAERFSFVCGADSGFGVKPGPGMVQGFAAAVGCTAEKIAVVGDTLHDLNMAQAAGAGIAVGVLTGASRAEDLSAHADVVLSGVHELPTYLDRFN